MATKKIKKSKKSKPRLVYRNRARASPRATAEAEPREREMNHVLTTRESPGRGALKAFGGALASTIAGAYLAQQDWVPPKVMTGLLSGLGALLALEGPPQWTSLGLGAMSAAGGQLGFMLIDDQLIKTADERDKREPTTKPAASASPAPKRQAADIPADALARAYERALRRMALTSDAAN